MSPKILKQAQSRRLGRRAIDALIKGRHADIGGKAVAARAKNLLQIAMAYSFDELLDEPGIGHVTAREIQLWLDERGASLRHSTSGA